MAMATTTRLSPALCRLSEVIAALASVLTHFPRPANTALNILLIK
jgi:hypothetical protein